MQAKHVLYSTLFYATLLLTTLSMISEKSVVQEADIQRILAEPGNVIKEITESEEEVQIASVEALQELIVKHGQHTTNSGVNFAEQGINILSTLLDQIASRKVVEEIFLQFDILDAENEHLSDKAKEQITLNLQSKEEYLKNE